MGSPASHGVPQPPQGWQPSHGIGGSFAVESMAALPWNRWQACYGISGSFRVERVAALPWNQWQDSPGIGGSFAVEYASRGLYGTLQFLGGRFLKLAGADVVSHRQTMHI